MPFTPSHIAAVLPVRRASRLPLDALAIGAMSPDFEYLLRLTPAGGFGHTVMGVFFFCLPVSVVVLAAYRWVVRPAALDLFPQALLPRPDRLPGLGPVPLLLAGLAIVLGAFTHLVWDGFTHERGWFVLAMPWLREEAFLGVARYRVGQHGSTLFGGLVLMIAVTRWWRAHPAEARHMEADHRRRIVSALAVVVGCSAVVGGGNALRGIATSAERIIAHGAVGALVGCAAGLLLVGLRHRRALRPSAQAG